MRVAISVLVLLTALSCKSSSDKKDKKDQPTDTADTTAPTAGASGSLNISDVTHTTVNISWTAGSDNKTAAANLQYKVVRSNSANIDSVANAESNGVVVKDWTPNLTNELVANLDVDQTYYFNVLVKDAANNTSSYVQTSVDTPEGLNAKHLALGEAHTCIIRRSGGVRCWGSGTSGQLGTDATNSIGAAANHMPPPNGVGADINLGSSSGAPVQISAGLNHTCVLFDSGKIRCWGGNANGRLGIDSTTSVGNGSGTAMADAVDVIGISDAIQVAAGYSNTCALLANGEIKCWGQSTLGQLGVNIATPQGDAPGEMATLTSVIGITNATQITAGTHFYCARLSTGKVKCWGNNNAGQLGIESTDATRGSLPGEMEALPEVIGIDNAVSVHAGSYHACALLNDGNVKCWGEGSDGQLGSDDTASIGRQVGEMTGLGVISNLANIKQVTASGYFTCVLNNTNQLKCFGNNLHGQLGADNTNNMGGSPGDMASLPAVLGISDAKLVATGNVHTCALFNDDRLKCWGRANSGRLGHESIENRGDDAGEMSALIFTEYE